MVDDERVNDEAMPDERVEAGRVLSRPQAMAAGVALALLVLLGIGTAVALGSGDDATSSTDTTHEEHVEVDPVTDQPIEDPCDDAPEMCGDDAGGVEGGCDEPGMCGDISPDGATEEIDAGTGTCEGELCGDVGPGVEDSGGP